MNEYDPRHFVFERKSGLPDHYFDGETWWSKLPHRLVFWIPLCGLLCALVFQW
jgi:hypothetical protein